MSRARRTTGHYPLWLGVLALGGSIALWQLAEAPPTTAPAVDAGPDSEAPAPARPDTALVWRVEGRGPIEAGTVDVCLVDAGYGRSLVVGDERLVVTSPGRTRPIRIEPIEGGLLLTTPVERDARLAATLHVALTACLYQPDAAVVDPALDRRFTGSAWPQLGEGGGPPIEALVAIDPVHNGLRTRGLDRLGRVELGLSTAEVDAAAARRLIAQAAAAAVVAEPDAEVLTLATGDARLVDPERARAAGWWRAPPTDAPLRVLADAEGEALRPARLPRPAARPEPATRAPPKRTPRQPARRDPAESKPPKRAAEPRKPAPGGFRPEYR